MTDGSVETMTISQARHAQASSQTRLASFGNGSESNTKYIGTVHSASDDYREVVEENIDALAPDSELFYQFQHMKDQFEDDGKRPEVAHNDAIEYINYPTRYEEQLRSNPDAMDQIRRLRHRLEMGDDIVLVCYCSDGRWCHTETIKSLLMET